MLSPYLGKSERFKSERQCKQNALIFTCTNFNESCWLIYWFLADYFSLWFLLNILLNNTLFYVNRSKCWQRPCTLGMRHCTTCRSGYTSFIWQDLWPSNSQDLSLVYYKVWGVVQQRVCQLRAHNIGKQKQCLLNVWRWMGHFVTLDATIHILGRMGKCGHLSNIMTVLISFQLYDMKCLILVTHDIIFY